MNSDPSRSIDRLGWRLGPKLGLRKIREWHLADIDADQSERSITRVKRTWTICASLIVQDFQRRGQRVAPQDPEALLTSGVASAQSLSTRELAPPDRQMMPK